MPRLLLLTLVIILGCTAALAANVTIVNNGAPQAQIVVPAGASEDLKTTAATLADYLKQSSGGEVPIITEDALAADAPGQLILLGQTKRWPVTFPKGFDDDGFIIAARGRAVSICGPTDWGTEFGVYDFLERYVGVRWLMPGENGTDVPRMKTIAIPEGKVQDQPVFFTRLFSGLRGAPQAQWARCNRMHGRVLFHHSLGQNVFQPEKYTKTHPEFFPMKDGQTRYLPKDGMYHGWQPCFSAPGSVETAVETICAYFKANPTATSFSLGTNDSSGFCRCPACLAKIAPEKKNFLNMTDYSDQYYEWCNQVIEGVLKQYPDKWFGCLAYSEVAAPPTKVKVHERLIPYMTYDRMKWIDPQIEQASHEATEAWHKVSPTLGWYDYIYGSPYALPRVFFHQSQKYLQYGQQQGVKAHYAEIYPNWGEGPKPYIFLKLWWNPNQDVDKLLAEWYDRCVGPAAAPDLAKYYAIWERFWTKDILNSKWFSSGGQYLAFYSPAYLADVKPADLAESRRLMDSILAKCQTPQQRARAELLEKAFQYYEASVMAYQASQQGFDDVSSEAGALKALDGAAVALEMSNKRRTLALEEFAKDAVLVQPIGIENSQLDGRSWGGSGIWAVMDWVLKGDNAVRRKVVELCQSKSPLVAEQAQFMLAVADGKAETVSRNPSFDKPTAPWSFWVKSVNDVGPAVGKMTVTDEVAHTGKTSVLCDSMLRGGPVQDVPFAGPGRYIALAWVYCPPGQQMAKGTVELAITPRDEKGNITTFSTKIIPTPGEWKLIVVGANIPATVQERTVKTVFVVPIVDNIQDGKVYLDDVTLQKMP
jgi:hypothetical protein